MDLLKSFPVKRRDYTYPSHCLEVWGFWKLGNNGYSSKSPIARIGEVNSREFGYSIPKDVISNNRDIDRVNLVFAIMQDYCAKSRSRADVLKRVTLNRTGNESIKETMNKLKIGKSERFYYEALEEFSIRLEVVISQV